MKKYSFLSCFLFSFAAYSQSGFESRIITRIDCEDIFYTALTLIPEYYHTNEKDSIIHFIDYWEKECGESATTTRVRTLYEIERGVFDKREVDRDYFQQLINYVDYVDQQSMIENNSHLINLSENEKRFYYRINEFNFFTSLWAQELLEDLENKCEEEAIILKAYSNDVAGFFEWIKDPGCESIMGALYQAEIDRQKDLLDGDLALLTGVWKPFGNSGRLGVHPELGFSAGVQLNRWLMDITMLLRFIKTPLTYDVLHDGNLLSTDYFLGGYVGGDVGYQLLKFKNSRYYLLGGVGWDGFDALEPDPEVDNEPSKTLGSLNLNLGMGTKWHYKGDRNYLGIEARYNFVNYNNPGGTDLSGNTMSIRLLFGVLGNYQKDYQLRRLRYEE